MYGTVARLQVRPGQEEAMTALQAKWLRERRPEVSGFITEYVLQSERLPSEWIVLAIFDSEASYRKNAVDPEQHRQYEELRALLTSDPEWNDGEILAIEPAAVPL